jgi:hypothetical protein
MNLENLTRIKTILEDFGIMSGLVCNVEKTSILPIGGQFQIDNRIRDLGFTIVDRLTVLGLEIDRDGYTQKNFTNIRKKICDHISSWRPLNLSLPGRINIAKSLLYSQINYLGCFLPVPEATISDWDKLITDFVKGKLNIAKKRLYLSPSDGGLGLFNISDFLDAQRCTWIRRSADLSEPWKAHIYVCNHCCLYNCKSKNIEKAEFPVCHNIVRSFEQFSNAFTATNENFKESYIFDNSKITLDLDTRDILSKDLFEENFFVRNAQNIYRLRYCDFYDDNGTLINANQILAITGVELTQLQIFRFRGACMTAKIKLKKKSDKQQKTTRIETFLNRNKKGSSHIRKILSASNVAEIPHNIRKFGDNLDIVITGEQSKFLNGIWKNNFFTNQEMTFLFKLHNNTLGYNRSVAHFVRGHSPYCTFCDIAEIPEPSLETPLHIFYECRFVADLIDNVFKRVYGDNNFLFSRREYFTNFERREIGCAKNMALTLIAKFILKYIWDCKTRFTLPETERCWDFLCDKILTLVSTNKKFRKLWEGSELNRNMIEGGGNP